MSQPFSPIPTAGQQARIHGTPGEQPRLRGLLRVLLPILCAVAAAGYLFGAALPWAPLPLPTVGGGLVVLALLLAIAVRTASRRLESFVKGARGEEAVGRILSLLPGDYAVFHGVTSGRDGQADDWDHVVVGPTGVFVVETKNWEGAIRVVDDRVLVGDREPDRPPLAQVERAANGLRALLRRVCEVPVAVQPLLCFTAPGAPARPVGVAGVIVCADRHLLDAILQRTEESLAPALRARIETALKDSLVRL
ncbi:MAG: NERD domain-containing protein [Lentisphaerae bacterium]|nr:NERD domain-containing protein [Lentisphaerota bacterium]